MLDILMLTLGSFASCFRSLEGSLSEPAGGGWGGWEAEDGLNYPLAQGKSRCVFNKAQKQPQCTCQDKTAAGSSSTPHAALLVRPSGTIHPVVDDCHDFFYLFVYLIYYCTDSN